MKRMILTTIFIGFFFSLCLTLFKPGVVSTPKLRVIACDVGQGDSILLLYGSLTVMIDTGPNGLSSKCLNRYLPFYRRTIDLLILTHDDADHIGGFSEIVKTFDVRRVALNPKVKDTKAGAGVSRWIQATGKGIHPKAGQSYAFPGLRLHVLWEMETYLQSFSSKDSSDLSNNSSLAFYVEVNGFGFLSLGDLECAQELAVTRSHLLKRVDLLKMSHHGSKTSSCLEFLERIRPETAFYSAGQGNTYGHPHTSSLENAQKTGSLVLGTDQIGEIEYLWDGQRLKFRSSRSLQQLFP